MEITIKLDVIGYNKDLEFTDEKGNKITYSNLVLNTGEKVKCSPDAIDTILKKDFDKLTLDKKNKIVVSGSVAGTFSRF